jgi:hypothetical protein
MPSFMRLIPGIVMRVKIIPVLTLLVFGQIACNANKKPTDLNLHVVVKGRVVDTAGRPVPGAKVQARLGLDLDGAVVETDSDGRFVAEAASDSWFKFGACLEQLSRNRLFACPGD